MAAQIVQIGKRRWLAGMDWRSFEDRPTKAELLNDAEGMAADWVSVRHGPSAIQAGFCAAVEGVAKPVKLNSLAAMLADSREQPWLGIFDLGNGRSWYVAVRDGHAILPDGDVIGDDETVLAVRQSHAGYDDWNYVEGDIELLAELIAEIDAKPTRVKSLAGSDVSTVAIAAATILLAGIAVGGGYWWHHAKQVEEQERLAAMTKMRAQLAGQAVATVVRSPLLDLAQSNEWLAACNRAIDLPLSKKGWELGEVGCDASTASVKWLYKPGATVAGRPDGIVSAQGDRIDQVIPLGALTKTGIDDAIDLDTAKLILRAWAQSAGFGLRFEAPPPPPQVLPGAPAPTKSVLPATATAVIDTSISPFGIDMSPLPGFRLTRIKTTDAGWHLEGTLYGR